MTCSECGAAPAVAGQRYCHVCGALLPHGAGAASGAGPAGTIGMAPYIVGDGSDRAMGALSRQLATEWLRANKGRLIVYGGAAAVALAAVVAVVIAVVATVVAFAPFALALFVLYLLVRPRRRRRRLVRIYRF